MQQYLDSILIKKPNGDIAVGAGAAVQVFKQGTSTNATIYLDNGATPKPNPFNADSEGRYRFFAPDGVYDIQISGFGIIPYKILNVELYDADENLNGLLVNAILKANLQIFANNTAAAGLANNTIYRTANGQLYIKF